MALDGRMSELESLEGNEEEWMARMKGLEAEVEVEDIEVAIVGGGLAGLAVLAALQRRGMKAHLFEKYPDLRSDTATAIGIGPNGVTALEGIQSGLSKIISELGVYTKLLKVDIAVSETEVSSRSVEWADATYITVNWKLVQQALAKLVSKDCIHCSHELLFYKQTEDGLVNAYFDAKEEKNSNSSSSHIKVIHTHMLIGADGIWSVVRRQMVNDEARYLHMVDWNAIVYDPHQKLLENIGRGEIYLHTDAKQSMTYLLANAGDYALWILRKVDETGELGQTLLKKHGSYGDPRSKIRALQKVPDTTRWHALKKAIERTDEKSIFERKIMDRLPLYKWSDVDGRVLLVGDAAHAQYVGPGQGARTAFEDAHQLAILLEEAKQTGFSLDSIQKAVNMFEEVRIPRMTKMQDYAAFSTRQARFQPEWVQKLSVEEREKMGMEYMKWVEVYPENQQGDPESTYFK